MTERKADPVATLTRKCFVLAFLSAYVLNLGCTSIREVPMADAMKAEKVYSVTRLSGKVVEFNDDGGIINSYRGTIDGTSLRGIAVSIPLDDVKSVRVDRTNAIESVIWTVAILGAVVGTIAAILSAGDFGFM